ncbi:MAG: DUF1858 domain-containing protein [Actinomycetia bacterium]|nr:DUF1858 domain-containing protein [Actinomycetes bacterium]
MSERPEITPQTRVAALLRDYPETEELLIGMSPAFVKLRNPVLRRSVARVATLAHAAAVGQLPVDELVNNLRAAVGQAPRSDLDDDQVDYFGTQPPWFDAGAVVAVLRDSELDPDVMPINPVLRAARDLDEGEIIELVTSHLPAPGIDILRRKAYQTWTTDDGDLVHTFITKPSTESGLD